MSFFEDSRSTRPIYNLTQTCNCKMLFVPFCRWLKIVWHFEIATATFLTSVPSCHARKLIMFQIFPSEIWICESPGRIYEERWLSHTHRFQIFHLLERNSRYRAREISMVYSPAARYVKCEFCNAAQEQSFHNYDTEMDLTRTVDGRWPCFSRPPSFVTTRWTIRGNYLSECSISEFWECACTSRVDSTRRGSSSRSGARIELKKHAWMMVSGSLALLYRRGLVTGSRHLIS